MKKHQNHCCCGQNMNEKNDLLHKCQECGLEYKEKEVAEKCEKWCKENKSCNLEIIKHAVNKYE